MCVACNNKRGEKDALEPQLDPPVRVAYNEVFHPIKRPVGKHVELEFIGSTNGREQMHFSALPDQSLTWLDSVAVYDALFSIPTRWQDL
jgi:hypothetical protein